MPARKMHACPLRNDIHGVRRTLAAACALAISASSIAQVKVGGVVQPGQVVQRADQTSVFAAPSVEVTGASYRFEGSNINYTSSAGNALALTNGGTLLLSGNDTVTAQAGVGLQAQGAGNVLSITDGGGLTLTSSCYGLNAQNGSLTVIGNNVTVNAGARAAHIRAGNALVMSGIGHVLTSNGASGLDANAVTIYDNGSSAAFGQVTATSNRGDAISMSGGTGQSLTLGSGSVIRAAANGITSSGATASITTNGLTINAGTGYAFAMTGAGSVANFVGANTLTALGGGINVSGAATQLIASPGTRFDVRVSGGGAGLNANAAAVGLGTGSTISTETGPGISGRAGANVTASGLRIVTNTSQQPLVQLLQALSSYPNLGGVDPIDTDPSGDPHGIGVYQIASPSRGVDLGQASFQGTGTTSITSGGIGVILAGASTASFGGLTVKAGPGGNDNTWMDGVSVGAASRLTVAGPVNVTVDSVAGNGIYVKDAGSTASVDVGPDVLTVNLVDARNLSINNVNEAGALRADTGILAVSGDASLQASQGRGYGLWTGTAATSAITMNGNTSVETHGREAFGLRMDNGAMTFNGDLAIVTGRSPVADAVDGLGSAGTRVVAGNLMVNGTTSVETHGGIAPVGSTFPTSESAYGLWTTSASRIAGDGGVLRFGDAVTVSTVGAAAHGIYNDSKSGTMEFIGPTSVTTQGGQGTVTWYRATLSYTESVGAWGVNMVATNATTNPSITFRDALNVTTSGAASGGVRSTGGTVYLNGTSTITTQGTSAHGLYATSKTTPVRTNGTIAATGPVNVSVSGAGANAVMADQAATLSFLGGGRLRVGDPAAKGVLASGASTVTGAGVFDIAADLESNGTANLNVSTSAGSVFTGKTTRRDTSVFNLSLQDSTWNLTDNSNLTNLVNDPSLIDFAAPVAGAYKALDVNNYSGDGTLALNTYLAGDGAPSDRLIIYGGTATGNSALRIKNTGGAGDLTRTDGILVVQAAVGGTTDPGAFHLGNVVVAGPYEYTLHRGSVDGSAPDSWYLRSDVSPEPPPTPPPPPPTPPTPPPTPPTPPPTPPDPPPAPAPGPAPSPSPAPMPMPNYRAEVSLYAALPALALQYGLATLGNLHERVGEEEQLRGRADLADSDTFNGAWVRVIGQNGNYRGDAQGIYGTGPKYDYSMYALQVGSDVYREDHEDGHRDQAGLYVAQGRISSDVTHYTGQRAGTSSVEGLSLGSYWTHFWPEGSYLDAVLQGTWADAKAHSVRGFDLERKNVFGWAASLESGYVFQDNNHRWEPQAQLIYQTVDKDQGTDSAARVRFDNVKSLALRLGLRWAVDTIMGPSPSGYRRMRTTWLRLNYWHEFRGAPTTSFSTASGEVPFKSDLASDWWQLNAGATWQLAQHTSFYANAGYERSFNGQVDGWDAKVGLRWNW